MFGWFKRKASTPPVTPAPQVPDLSEAVSDALGKIEWSSDAYRSARFLLGMYGARGVPFSLWRSDGANFTLNALGTAETCTQSYQLVLWFWLVDQNFGAIAGKMARDAFLLAAEEVSPEDNLAGMFEWLLNAHEDAYRLFSEMSADKLQVPVNGKMLQMPREYHLSIYFFLKLDGSPYFMEAAPLNDDDVWALAECLVHGSKVAQQVYAPMQAAFGKFDPNSFEKWRWSTEPGAHEMHLMRRHNNPLFSPSRQTVSGADVYAARVRDAELRDEVRQAAILVRKELNETDLPSDWSGYLDDMRQRVDALMDKALRLGQSAADLEDHLGESRSFILDIWVGAFKGHPEKLAMLEDAEDAHRARQDAMFETEWLRQVGNPERAIPAEELVAALLSDEPAEFAKSVRNLESDERLRSSLLATRTDALGIVQPLLAAGRSLPGIRDKMAVLGVAV